MFEDNEKFTGNFKEYLISLGKNDLIPLAEALGYINQDGEDTPAINSDGLFTLGDMSNLKSRIINKVDDHFGAMLLASLKFELQTEDYTILQIGIAIEMLNKEGKLNILTTKALNNPVWVYLCETPKNDLNVGDMELIVNARAENGKITQLTRGFMPYDFSKTVTENLAVIAETCVNVAQMHRDITSTVTKLEKAMH